MAAAVRQTAVPEFLEDILHYGHGVDAAEHIVRAEEVGKLVSDIAITAGTLVLGIKRGTERYPFHKIKNLPLKVGDIIVYLVASENETA